MKRFASIIDMKSYQPGSFIRLFALIIMIFIVPTQLFCDGFIKEKETTLILKLQANFLKSCQGKDTACGKIMFFPHFLFDNDTIIFIMFILHLVGDSWLAYKTTLVTSMGIYFLSFI